MDDQALQQELQIMKNLVSKHSSQLMDGPFLKVQLYCRILTGTTDHCLQTDTEMDDQALQKELQGIKTGGVKTLISIGGWSFSQGSEAFAGSGSEQIFPSMASTNASRSAFIQSAISYAKGRGFDGIDIDWE